MDNNLPKRIQTSIILSLILLSSLFFHKYSWLLLLIIVSIISLLEFSNLVKTIWKRKKTTIYILNLISFFYLLFFVYSSYDLYKTGLIYTIFIILVCSFSDIGGYVIGKSIGGKKLTKISPNKTISGSIGSFIFSLFPILIFLIIYKITANNDYRINNNEFNTVVILCLFTCLICQLGDLLISYFKRKAKVKDSGSILPGHGGLLDRIDGILFAIPSVIIFDKIFF